MRCHLKQVFLLAAGLLILTRVYIYMRREESGNLKVFACANSMIIKILKIKGIIPPQKKQTNKTKTFLLSFTHPYIRFRGDYLLSAEQKRCG